MRLIATYFLIFKCFFIGIQLSKAQYVMDSIYFNQSEIKERHIQFIYNYSLNAALFQYQSGLLNSYAYPGIKNHIVNRKNLYLVKDKISPEIKHLERFILPAKFCHLTYLIGSHEKALQLPIMTQYNIQLYSSSKTERSKIFSEAFGLLRDSGEGRFVVAFSGLYKHEKHYYLELVVGYHQYFNPVLFSKASYIFEFEWCDSRKIMYPMRTVDETFSFQLEQNFPIRFGRTVILPSKVCPN